MKLDLESIVRSVTMVGAQAPAYVALFRSITAALSPADQDTLKSRLQVEMTKSDQAHEDLQTELDKIIAARA